jgi:peptidoglycan/xylan/chitin deacetylase (PgdA/CDA1 family)
MSNNMHGLFERGIVVISIDTEQIWGYSDLFTEAQFNSRFPDAIPTHDRLLFSLRAAGVSATWFVVGGLSLHESAGTRDPRMAALPVEFTERIPAAGERTAPLWYHPEFIRRLRESFPAQEIGLHGGLTHFIWTDPRATREVARQELVEGIKALGEASIWPRSFSFPRNAEQYLDLLPEYGIRCYRGAPQDLAWRMGRTLPGAILRVMDELRYAAPLPVWPYQMIPGLWSIPASMFLYPLGPARARIVGLRSRLARFSRGLEAAARYRGIFHFCLHPENLAESPHGLPILDDILDALLRARASGDVEVMTMSDVLARMERIQPHVSQEQQSYAELLETHRRS